MPALMQSRVSANAAEFGGLAIDQPADQHRAANVRDDEAHLQAHLVIHDAIPLIAKDAEEGNARR